MQYDRRATIAYAQKWAFGRNPLYLNFDALGGDCTNFVSQCLYAGYPEMNDTKETGWYYRSSYERAPAWTGVEFLYRFLVLNQGPGPRAIVTQAEAAQPGDVVQLGNASGRYYHSLLFVASDGGEPLMAAHSDDVWMRPLSGYRREHTRFLHIL